MACHGSQAVVHRAGGRRSLPMRLSCGYLRVFRPGGCYRKRLRTVGITTFRRRIEASVLRRNSGPGGMSANRRLGPPGGGGACSGVGNARSLRGMAEPGDGAGLSRSICSGGTCIRRARYLELTIRRWRASFDRLRGFRWLVSHIGCRLLAFVRSFRWSSRRPGQRSPH